jgi:hypothetical protein
MAAPLSPQNSFLPLNPPSQPTAAAPAAPANPMNPLQPAHGGQLNSKLQDLVNPQKFGKFFNGYGQ